MNMKSILTSWNPWHLRRRLKAIGEDLEKLTECRDDLVNSCQQFVIRENERLQKVVLHQGLKIAELEKENAQLVNRNHKLFSSIQDIGYNVENVLKNYSKRETNNEQQ